VETLATTVGAPRAGDVTIDIGPTVTIAPLLSVTATLTHAVPAVVGVQSTVALLAEAHPEGSPVHW
jgi:hypothetical protein